MVTENIIGRLRALEDATKRLVAAVRKSAMMQLVLETMGVGIKSEISRAVRRWKEQTQARRMRRWVQRMFLATYAYCTGRKTTTSQTSLDMQLRRDSR